MRRLYLSPPDLAPADREAVTDGWEWAERAPSSVTACRLTRLTVVEQIRLLETHDVESHEGVRAAFGAS